MQPDIIFLDIETTGLDANKHEIIELAAIRADYKTLGVISIYECKIYPQRIHEANPMSLKINGYSSWKWKGKAIPLDHALKNFISISENAIPCGHNIQFDLRFINAACSSTRLLHKLSSSYINILDIAKKKLQLKNYKLNTICEHLKLPKEPDVHMAINGAKSAYNVYATLRAMKEPAYGLF